DLINGHRSETIPFAFDQPFLGNRLEGVGRGVFGGDPGALFLQGRIDSFGKLLLGFVASGTRLCETYGWPPTEMKLLLFVQETVVEAPQLRAVRLDDKIEILGVGKV